MTTEGQRNSTYEARQPDPATISLTPSARPHHRHPELVSGSVLTKQSPDTEMNSA
jgi:hypothetical protein